MLLFSSAPCFARLLLPLVLCVAGPGSLFAAVDFDRDVRPLLNAHCAACHGGVKKNGGFSVISRDLLLAETDSGINAVIPGDAANSELIRRVTAESIDERMPPDGHGSLSKQEVQLLIEWIDSGARWPEHWSYKLVPPLPNPQQFGTQHPIDWYVCGKLSANDLEPSPPADRRTLIRRLALDLTGLLPTTEQVSRFVDNPATDAFATLVGRLLDSPHFGERWARHWLDEARYADSEGYEKDTEKLDAWRFRDWVINAINEDMPFDDFTRRQIAGDLLHDATEDDLIATKFHLQTQFNLEGGVDAEEDRTKRVIDRVGTLGSVWLGASIACCQCHDHPYDSFRQKDFYRLYGFFNNMDFTAEFLGGEPENAAKSREARARKWKSLSALLEQQLNNKNLSSKVQSSLSSLRKFDNSAGLTRFMHERILNRRTTFVFERGDFRRPIASTGEVQPDVPNVLGHVEPHGGRVDRLDLANWLVERSNPLTARVTVNKIWMHLFGQPLADQPQEFGSRGTVPSHPLLLDYLAAWFMDEANWSRKALIRFIVTSKTWQQSSDNQPELQQIDPDNRLLARQNRFRVEAELVRDVSLQTAGLLSTKVGGVSVFPPLPAMIAQQTYAGSFKYKPSTGEDRYRRGMYTFFRRTAIDPNLSTFDCPDSSMTRARRDRSNNPLQALATLHNEVFHEAAQAFAVRVLAESGSTESDTDRLNRAFEIALGRKPTTRETYPLERLLNQARNWYADRPDDAKRLVGDHRANGPIAENAAWVATLRTVLNLDEFLTRS